MEFCNKVPDFVKNHQILFKRFGDLSNRLAQEAMTMAKTLEEMSKVTNDITQLYSNLKSYSIANCYDVLKGQLTEWSNNMKQEAKSIFTTFPKFFQYDQIESKMFKAFNDY